jgi:hypothetical protein
MTINDGRAVEDRGARDDANRRRGKIRISEGDLRNLLDLPEGYRIEGIVPSYDPPGLSLLVTSPTLPTVPYDAEAPYLTGHLQRNVRYDAGTDKRWFRGEWVLG